MNHCAPPATDNKTPTLDPVIYWPSSRPRRMSKLADIDLRQRVAFMRQVNARRPGSAWYRDLVPYNAVRQARLFLARLRGKHREADWLAMRERARGVCAKCGTGPHWLEPDHVVPISRGGSDSISNIQPLCRGCNRNKGRDTVDWLAARGLR